FGSRVLLVFFGAFIGGIFRGNVLYGILIVNVYIDEEQTLLVDHVVLFFKLRTAYEIGLGIPAEPLFRSHQSFQATAGFRDYAPNAYSSSNGWSVFYQ